MTLASNILTALKEKSVPEDIVEKLEELGFDTEEVLIASEKQDLLAVGIPLAAALKIKSAFPCQGSPLLSPELSVSIEAGSTADNTNPYGEYARFVTAGSSVIGINGDAILPQINREAVKRAAVAASVSLVAATGALEIFDNSFWSRFQIEDFAVRDWIDAWLHQVETAQIISFESMRSLFEGVSTIFDERFETLIKSAQKLQAQKEALSNFAGGATVDVGADAIGFAGLASLIPLAAEEISANMLASRMPEQARRASTLLQGLLAILKDQSFLAAVGCTNQPTSEQGMIKFLESNLGRGVANGFRLAIRYENLINLIAICPARADSQYLAAVGAIAQEIDNLHSMVVPVQSSGLIDQSSRRSGSPAETGFKLSFSLNLKFNIGK